MHLRVIDRDGHLFEGMPCPSSINKFSYRALRTRGNVAGHRVGTVGGISDRSSVRVLPWASARRIPSHWRSRYISHIQSTTNRSTLLTAFRLLGRLHITTLLGSKKNFNIIRYALKSELSHLLARPTSTVQYLSLERGKNQLSAKSAIPHSAALCDGCDSAVCTIKKIDFHGASACRS